MLRNPRRSALWRFYHHLKCRGKKVIDAYNRQQ
ncbi:hypothetical protein SME04J_43180 [Serratia marcescens]|nr:hypothetical protein SME04J_43180 [Serratia marcescens]